MRLCTVTLASAMVLLAEQFPPADVKIVGDVDYGQTTPALQCASETPYCSVLFNGTGGDKLTITVKNAAGKAFVALTDGSLTELARGTDRLSFTLPKANEELQTYYIVFRDVDRKAASFTVKLEKAEK